LYFGDGGISKRSGLIIATERLLRNFCSLASRSLNDIIVGFEFLAGVLDNFVGCGCNCCGFAWFDWILNVWVLHRDCLVGVFCGNGFLFWSVC